VRKKIDYKLPTVWEKFQKLQIFLTDTVGLSHAPSMVTVLPVSGCWQHYTGGVITGQSWSSSLACGCYSIKQFEIKDKCEAEANYTRSKPAVCYYELAW